LQIRAKTGNQENGWQIRAKPVENPVCVTTRALAIFQPNCHKGIECKWQNWKTGKTAENRRWVIRRGGGGDAKARWTARVRVGEISRGRSRSNERLRSFPSRAGLYQFSSILTILTIMEGFEFVVSFGSKLTSKTFSLFTNTLILLI